MADTMRFIIMHALLALWALIVALIMILMAILCFRKDSSNRDHEIGVTNYPIAEQGMQGPPLQKHEEASRPIMVRTVVQYKNEEGTESRCTECVICLEEFKDGDSCRVLTNCNHLYHQLCIDEWLVKNSHCPLCRGSTM
ncbi:hypothetical protein E1A91_A10G227200v1 [Gossypium mustelinum]|uniref:RING-type domain-containing protein n=1 Tax=Gossypium mustelinum TaxID=34275 RepID=A0A5D2XQC1_GOSMU|nr:hypothetical protein E1A91_A10G227200v1 [Gossypium mustelinum]